MYPKGSQAGICKSKQNRFSQGSQPRICKFKYCFGGVRGKYWPLIPWLCQELLALKQKDWDLSEAGAEVLRSPWGKTEELMD